MAEFFSQNLIFVFFFYGLAFFSMGLAVLLEIGHSSELDFAQALKPLAGFGLIHGFHEWFEMGLIIQTRLTGEVEPEWVFYLRLVLLSTSFIFLIAFGIRMILGPGKQKRIWTMLTVITMIWLVGLAFVLRSPFPTRSQLIAADVYTRYALAIPGAALTCWGLILQGRAFYKAGMRGYSLDVMLAAIAFALYGGIGQFFASPSILFPSDYINSEVFLRWVGFPIQGFRALMAIIAAIFIIRSLRAFDQENRRRIEELDEARQAEQKRLEALRAELLHRTVQAQEQERLRIARELHDETGQTLTAINMGLTGLSLSIPTNPERAVSQARKLQQLASDGITGLQRLVSGLHPPQLDELGLLHALRWYAQEISKHSELKISVSGSTQEVALSEEVRLTIFRIAQEAITNAMRHSQADQVKVMVDIVGSTLLLEISDNGQGFNVDQALMDSELKSLGLLGMIERARLIGGECEITSRLGKGTVIQVIVNYDQEYKTANQPAAGG
jgi:signal transduction histidine kinase